MKNKNKILKNYLNINTFNSGLLNQQNNLIHLYNNENFENINILESEINYYSNNNSHNYNFNKITEQESKCANIFNIRLNQTKDKLIKLSQYKWPNNNICKNILELKGNVNYN